VPGPPKPAFEILEHTADIGVRSHGATEEEAFENAARGLLEILGAESSRDGGSVETVDVRAADREALLVSLMDELIFRTDSRPTDGIARIEVRFGGPSALRATLRWGPRRRSPEAIELKAATYHQLSVKRAGAGWVTTVFFDV